MSELLIHGDKLEKELTADPVAIPATGSVLLHSALAGGILIYFLLSGLIHHSLWGDVNPGSAVEASITSSLPLPSDQPLNDNVLPTDNPSTAPAPPDKKTVEAEDKSAIPIADKVKQKQDTPQQKNLQPKKDDTKAQFGQQNGSVIARSTQVERGPLKLSNADFANKYAWYADGISRKMTQNTYRNEIDGSTKPGLIAEIHFRLNRDGVPSDFKLTGASASQTLNTACMRAAQRIDTFGRLPEDSHDQYLDVTYDCKY